jgi:hypothetical protein
MACTLQTCPIELAYLLYDPNLARDVLFLAIFALLLPLQLLLGYLTRTTGITLAMFISLSLQIIGYVGRVQVHFNPFLEENFLMYLIPLMVGPVFIAAAAYLCLARIVVVYGEAFIAVRPNMYTLLFCAWDSLSLVLQAIGGAIAALAETRKKVGLRFYSA